MRTIRLFSTFPLAIQLLLVNQLGVNTAFFMLIPYLVIHLDNLGLSAAVIGLVLGVRNLSQQGLFLIGGSASDRLGARRVIIAGCALRVVGFGLFALGTSSALLLAASVLTGLAGALFSPAVRGYIAVAARDRRAEAFSLFNVFANTGALLGPVLGGLLLLASFQTAAVIAAGIFAVLTVAQLVALPTQPAPPSTTSVLGDWRECLGNGRFVAFTLALTGMYALQTQLYLVLPVEVERLTGMAGGVAALFLISTVSILLLQVRITQWWQQRGGSSQAIGVGMAVLGVAFLPPAFAHLAFGAPTADLGATELIMRLAPLLLSAFLLALGVMIAQPFVLELIPGYGREGLAGTYFGVFYLVSGLTAAGANAVLGWMIDLSRTGGDLGWLPSAVCVATGLSSAVAVAWLRRRGWLTTAQAKPAVVEQPV